MGEEKNRVFHAGKGANGSDYGVVRINRDTPATIRRKPCPTCPWRKDALTGAFPAEAFRSSASTAYDASLTTFSCHESGAKKNAICAGFILANSENNMAMRIKFMNGQKIDVSNPEEVELYESYRAMAIANGVNPGDPRIAPCRGDDENGFEVADRVRKAGLNARLVSDDIISELLDENHDELMKK